MPNWIKTSDRLPEPGKWVFARHNRGTWIDKKDPKNVNCVVVKLAFGLSLKDRQKIKDGLMPEPKPDRNWWMDEKTPTPRSDLIRACDEYGNNEKPYNWEDFGPDSFWGQEIYCWMEIPPED